MRNRNHLPDTVILAGGKGTRLRSAVWDRPQPMAEVAGRPFLDLLPLAFRSQGVRRVVLCTGYMSDVIEEYVGDGGKWGLEVLYSRDPIPLGTAGAVRHAMAHLQSDRLLVANADSYCRFNLSHLEEFHRRTGARATVLLTRVEDCRRYGSVVIGEAGAVENFREKPPDKCAGLINAGIYLLEREIVGSIPEARAVSIESEIFPRMIGHGLFAVIGEGRFLDIGTPETYSNCQRLLRATIWV